MIFARTGLSLEIPGFRKGKVPLKVIEKRFGPSIRHGVIEDLLPMLIHEASEQAGLVPAGSPRITALDEPEGGGLTFTASIDIWPEVEVQGDESLEIEKVTHEVTDAEIDEQIEEIEKQIKILEKERYKLRNKCPGGGEHTWSELKWHGSHGTRECPKCGKMRVEMTP